MSTNRSECAWCGSHMESERDSHRSESLCPECNDAYETEAHRSYHPVEERRPHNN